MEEKEALMTATFFSCRYGRIPVSVLSARLLWQYDSTASTVPTGTLQRRAEACWKVGPRAPGVATCVRNTGRAWARGSSSTAMWQGCVSLQDVGRVAKPLPVEDIRVDVQRQPCDADGPHQTLLLQLLECRQRVSYDLHRHRCATCP